MADNSEAGKTLCRVADKVRNQRLAVIAADLQRERRQRAIDEATRRFWNKAPFITRLMMQAMAEGHENYAFILVAIRDEYRKIAV